MMMMMKAQHPSTDPNYTVGWRDRLAGLQDGLALILGVTVADLDTLKYTDEDLSVSFNYRLGWSDADQRCKVRDMNRRFGVPDVKRTLDRS